MERGDLSNEMPGRLLVVFNGLLGTIPDNRRRRVELLRAARRWRAVAESYDIDLWTRSKLHDLAWRRNLRVDCVLFDHEKVAEFLEHRFNRLNLAIANVYALDGPKELVERLPYMPEVLWVVHGDPEWTYAFGSKGHLGLASL